MDYREPATTRAWPTAVVDMGSARARRRGAGDGGRRGAPARFVDMGNPHVVVLGEPVDDAVVAGLGPGLAAPVPDAGANVEFVWPGPDAGRAAPAGVGARRGGDAGLRHRGLRGGRRGRVAGGWCRATPCACTAPGGALEVALGDDGIVLAGPTRHVADVDGGRGRRWPAWWRRGLEPTAEVATPP